MNSNFIYHTVLEFFLNQRINICQEKRTSSCITQKDLSWKSGVSVKILNEKAIAVKL